MGPGGAERSPEHLVVGQVTKPHGTRGEVFVWPLTDRPEDVFGEGAAVLLGSADGEVDDAAETCIVESVRAFKRGLLVRFEGREGLAAVAPLAGRYLLVRTEDVAALEDGEVFYHQLLGMDVVTVEGEPVGRVQEVYETEPAHLLEVRGADDRLRLVPFSERIVKEVDAEGRRVVIAPPPGLLDL